MCVHAVIGHAVHVLVDVAKLSTCHRCVVIGCVTPGRCICNRCHRFPPWPQLTDLLRAYYEGDVTAKSLSRNLVLTVEVLEEVMDYGVPQVTDPTALRSLITQKGVK